MKKSVKHDRKTGTYTYLGMPPVSHPLVRQCVNRRHVGESYRSVIRYVIDRCFKKGIKQSWKEEKKTRRYLIAAAIQHHRENRVEYRQVMARSREEFVPSYFYDKDTQHVHIAPPIIPADLAAMKS